MKIRKGFVSNSSSSSFVCDVTGGIECGWDMSAEEAGMYECENGHTFYEDYLVNKEEYDKFCENDNIDSYDLRYELPSKFCPICTMTNIRKNDVLKYLLKSSNTTMKKVVKEIKEEYSSFDELIEDIGK